MLAYVFWHWPNPAPTPTSYERLQRDFHAALSGTASEGFLCSAAFRIEGEAPWLGGAPAYADWYLVEDSKALDPLNVAAVTGVCEQPHAKVAQAMAAGAGSLFTLRGNSPVEPRGNSSVDLSAATHLTFLTKPRAMHYDNFYPAIPSAPPETTLWRRTMVLGPTPEFALLAPQPAQGLAEFTPIDLALHAVWP